MLILERYLEELVLECNLRRFLLTFLVYMLFGNILWYAGYFEVMVNQTVLWLKYDLSYRKFDLDWRQYYMCTINVFYFYLLISFDIEWYYICDAWVLAQKAICVECENYI